MKAKANWYLDQAKTRAYKQITFALEKMARCGDHGSPWAWYDADGNRHECTAHHSHLEALRLCEWAGEPNQPCYFDYETHKWDTVYNMAPDKLMDCADSLLTHVMYNYPSKQ